MIWRALVLCVFLLVGCSRGMDAKIDGSSPEKFEKSMTEIKAVLTAEQLTKFQEAMTVLAFSDIDATGGLFGALAKMADPEKLQSEIRQAVNGKTPKEVIALAENKVRERQKKELENILSEIAELEKKQTEAQKSEAILSKIVIKNPRFYWDEGRFSADPIIEFDIVNNTTVPLARIFYRGTVATPGRSIPWIDEDFNHGISGGIEPGEKRHFRLGPNRFSSWGNADARNRKDTVFTMKVVNAEDADEKNLAVEFGKRDQERLEKLQEMKVNLEGKISAKM